MGEAWIDRASWSLRAPQFGELRVHPGRQTVAMEYEPVDDEPLGDWELLRTQWLDLPAHPHVLEGIGRGDGNKLLLRYAALHWQHPQVHGGLVGEWGVQMVDVYQMLVRELGDDGVALFMRPVLHIDLDYAARLAFLPGPGSAHDERAILRAIGEQLAATAGELDPSIRRVVDACREGRFRTLDLARAKLAALTKRPALRAGKLLAAWMLAEEAYGWIAVRRSERAIELLDRALALVPNVRGAHAARNRAFEEEGLGGPSPVPRRQQLTWSVAEPSGRELEAQRAYREALAIYEQAERGSHDAVLHTSMARCYLALGMAPQAIDHAQRALAIESNRFDAHAIRARGYLLAARFEDALKCSRAWLAAARDDAEAHYTLGRAQLGLGQLIDAREAFDRALALRPAMLEAMVLRREADRAARAVRAEVGEQPPFELDLPEHLAQLRDPLAHGRIAEAIAQLADARYTGDGAAALVHGHCLAFVRDFDGALAQFERALELGQGRAATLGKAHALLGLGRATDALALFEASDEDDLEALEGRALALAALGRTGEAEEAHAKLVAASGGRSELRVAAATGSTQR